MVVGSPEDVVPGTKLQARFFVPRIRGVVLTVVSSGDLGDFASFVTHMKEDADVSSSPSWPEMRRGLNYPSEARC